MLSNTSRWLTYLTVVLYASLGIFLFFRPEQPAPLLAFKVTPFISIAGWALGNAWLAVGPYLGNKNLNAFILRKPGTGTAA